MNWYVPTKEVYQPKYTSWQSHLMYNKSGMRWMQVKDQSNVPYIIIDSESILPELRRLVAEYSHLETITEKRENIRRTKFLLENYEP